MKFGLFMLPSWSEPDPKHQSRILSEMMEQIEFAEELGFDAVWLAEHHFTRYGIVPSALAMGCTPRPAPSVFASARESAC